jgi:hypothetical protein
MSTTVAVVPSIVSSPVDLVAAPDRGGVHPGEHLLDAVAELGRRRRNPVTVEARCVDTGSSAGGGAVGQPSVGLGRRRLVDAGAVVATSASDRSVSSSASGESLMKLAYTKIPAKNSTTAATAADDDPLDPALR